MHLNPDRTGITDVAALAAEHLALARHAPHGRSAVLFAHDGPLRQTVVALVAGCELADHVAPPAGTVHVLVGRIELVSGDGATTDVRVGEVAAIPQARHSVRAVDDAAFVLTAVTATPLGGRDWGLPAPEAS